MVLGTGIKPYLLDNYLLLQKLIRAGKWLRGGSLNTTWTRPAN